LAPPVIAAPIRLPVARVPNYGPLDLPDVAEDVGPPDGLTLEAAVDLLVRENLALRATASHIPQARAEVLQAGLRANPIFFADGQLVPYGRYNRDRPGGPNQYDLNVTHPIDYSGKRLARAAAAARALSVVEAQYQDAVRVQVDNLFTAYVDVLAARETVRFAGSSVAGLERLVGVYQVLYQKASATRADVGSVRLQLGAAEFNRLQAEESLRRAKRALAALLNLPPEGAERLEVRGSITDRSAPPPPADELVRLALAARPDLAAMRLGVGRAEADARLARASRWGDAYLLYQPYTFQDNTPVGLKSPTSWALGATIPLPVYNRNQGGIARASLNVEQTRVEVAALERKVVTEVLDADREYALTRALVERYETVLLPAATRYRDDALDLFVAGELDAQAEFNARRDYNDAVLRYRDALVRHRRSMLALNTAVGLRVLP
jgi:cobalt-zinc-cadmium efflux system outer membrane protein